MMEEVFGRQDAPKGPADGKRKYWHGKEKGLVKQRKKVI